MSHSEIFCERVSLIVFFSNCLGTLSDALWLWRNPPIRPPQNPQKTTKLDISPDKRETRLSGLQPSVFKILVIRLHHRDQRIEAHLAYTNLMF